MYKKTAMTAVFLSESDREAENRDTRVRMCYYWYTRINYIRTFGGIVRNDFKRERAGFLRSYW